MFLFVFFSPKIIVIIFAIFGKNCCCFFRSLDMNSDVTVVFPQNYIVTQVHHDLDPHSKFPSRNATSQERERTYYDYYHNNYQVAIKDQSQPLLSVKAISTKTNFLCPR